MIIFPHTHIVIQLLLFFTNVKFFVINLHFIGKMKISKSGTGLVIRFFFSGFFFEITEEIISATYRVTLIDRITRRICRILNDFNLIDILFG